MNQASALVIDEFKAATVPFLQNLNLDGDKSSLSEYFAELNYQALKLMSGLPADKQVRFSKSWTDFTKSIIAHGMLESRSIYSKKDVAEAIADALIQLND